MRRTPEYYRKFTGDPEEPLRYALVGQMVHFIYISILGEMGHDEKSNYIDVLVQNAFDDWFSNKYAPYEYIVVDGKQIKDMSDEEKAWR